MRTQKRPASRTLTKTRPAVRPHHRPASPVVQREAEDHGGREPDEPVREDVRHEREAHVARAAQGARRDGLDAVEDLEERRDAQQVDPDGDDALVGGEDAHERVRRDAMKTTALKLIVKAPSAMPTTPGRLGEVPAPIA